MPRKPIPIDPEEVEKLAKLHCTEMEVAAWFECNQSTISRRLARNPLKAIWERGWAKGNISIRRQQMQRAEAGDKTMLVWLGKQFLGQTDVARTEHTGADGGPIEVKGARQRLEDELAAIIAEADRAAQG